MEGGWLRRFWGRSWMHPTDSKAFAEASGLTLEEAELILARRRQATTQEVCRITLARLALQKAQAKTGVAPVVVTPGGLEKREVMDPEAEARFYADKLGTRPKRFFLQKPLSPEDVSQDPEDWK